MIFQYSCAMICVCSIISITSASYYNDVNLHGFVKLFKLHGTLKCTLHLAPDGAFCGATSVKILSTSSTIIWSRERIFFFFFFNLNVWDPLFHASG